MRFYPRLLLRVSLRPNGSSLNVNTFEEYQDIAAKVPIALRNNRDRIELPLLGLQEEAGKVSSVLTVAFWESGCPRVASLP